MLRPLLFSLVTFGLTLQGFSQVTNEVQVYVKPGTDVYVYENMTNASTGNFSVGEDGLLYVNGTLVNNGSMTFNNSASLLRGSVGSDGTGSGTYHVKRQGSTTSTVYNYWSSPMTSYGTVPGNSPYQYDSDLSTQTSADDQPADPGWVSFSGNMVPGKGYIGRGAGLYTFSGDVNNGNIAFPMVYYPYAPGNTAPGTPFNLCGNPYPSAISCAALVSANPDVNGSIYFWDDDLSGGSGYASSDYAVWNGTGSLGTGSGSAGVPNGYISTGQGFMIRSLNGSSVLNFNNSMRVGHYNTQFFKTNGDDSRLWFSIEGNNQFNQILIGVLEDATDNEDRLYDAVKIRGNTNITLAAQDNGREYAILAFPPPSVEKSIPLTVLVAEGGVHTFKAQVMENFEYDNVYFVDAVSSLSVQLEEGTEIPINLSEGLYENRFYLNFHSNSSVDVPRVSNQEMSIYACEGMLHLRDQDLTADHVGLEIFDLGGRKVYEDGRLSMFNGTSTVSLQGLATGVYLVRVQTSNGYINQKIWK